MKRLLTQSIGLAIAFGLSSPAISLLGLLPEKSAIAKQMPEDFLSDKAGIVPVERLEGCKYSIDSTRSLQKGAINHEGNVYQRTEDEIQRWLEILAACREEKDVQGEQDALDRLSSLYLDLGVQHYYSGNLQQAIATYEEAKRFSEEAGQSNRAILAVSYIAYAHNDLGQYERMIELSQQALILAQEADYVFGQALNLANIGLAYLTLGDYEQAAYYSDQALSIVQTAEAQWEVSRIEAYVLNDLGRASRALGDLGNAVVFHQQSAEIAHNTGTFYWETVALRDLGQAYQALGQFQLAMETYQQALALAEETGYLESRMRVLGNIANLLAQQNQPELAIAFYKQSVNLSEEIRQDLRELPQDVQKSYTETVAETYRALADLLLQQNRVLEAQRVLDLLKVQELDDYLRGVQRNAQTESGITLRPEELEALERFNAAQSQLIELGRELLELEAIALEDRTSEQAERIRELRQLQNDARTDFQTFLESDEIKVLITQLRQTDGATNLELSELNTLQDNLRRLEQNAVVLYPLILEDRLELIIVTANSPPLRRTVSVSREDLNRGIAEMRSALQSPSSDAVTPAQQLYDWLIRPIEADLEQANADTIIYAPDSQLRYIPLAALHDGNQWLTERFRVNNITAASIDDLDNQPTPELEILAAAFSEGQYTVPIRDRTLSFGGLEYAGREVENLSQLIPQTEKRLNEAFDSGIVLDMNDFSVVHLATHATFNPGPPEDSFILFGDGSKATLTDIKSWNFPNVELVVLSACETAVGDMPLGNGEEILGFGYLMQLAGADAAIASLWAVSDGGTQVLMNAFYGALQDGNSKAEALRQAQVALIERNFAGIEIRDRRDDGTVVAVNVETGLPPAVSNNLSHPYYWAPFILIGNGL